MNNKIALKTSPPSAKPHCPDLTLEGASTEAPIITAVDKMFSLALTHRASDIHLEPQAQGLFVRFRVDGMLRTIHEFPKTASGAIVSRIKILASMDISEKRLPQDGQIRTELQGRKVDLRISTLAGKYGEKVVIRLLDQNAAAVDLNELGMDPASQSQFEMMIEKPQGIILVTGPTGSGKTTTLYSALRRLRSPMKNIITLEDPIEYELVSENADEAGVTQVQVNSKIGLTFAAGLRASLRQDPDIIMVGEIRDPETAEVAMKASMTGHLVLSTLHTNSATDTIQRFRDIGIESYLIATTVIGVMAQRLVRILCVHCKEAYKLPTRAFESTFPLPPGTDSLTLYRPKGCQKCMGLGYYGRKGIYELLVMNEALKLQIHQNAQMADIKTTALANGMKSLRTSGLELVIQGITTVEEVYRNTVE